MTETPDRQRAPWWRRALAVAFAAAVVAGIALTVRAVPRDGLALLTRPAGVLALAVAVLANAAGVLLVWVSWRQLLAGAAARPGFRPEARIFFVSFLSKYLPGRVWSVLAQVEIGRRAGLAAGSVMAVFLLSLAVGVATGATVGLIAAPVLFGWRAAWLLALASLVVLGYARPELAYRACAWAARLVRRPLPDRAPDPRAFRRSLLTSLVSWVIGGAHLWPIAVLLGADPLRALPVCVGGFALSATAGMLVIVLPDGWGARDVLLGLVLATVLPAPAAALAAVASRLVCVVSEVLVGSVMLLATTAPRWAAAPKIRAGVAVRASHQLAVEEP